MNLVLLSVFIPTFFFVSITPGMCMTLALSLGLRVGYLRTLWMMLGELIGIGLVSLAAALGVASIIDSYPWLFAMLKYAGGAYLLYLGISMWRSKGSLALSSHNDEQKSGSNVQLMLQGFVTAVANPKGWAFMISLLPPFIDSCQSLATQLASLVAVILIIEFICMSIYSIGGKSLKHLLSHSDNIRTMNRISGALMVGVSFWLVMS
ncbi:MAG: LysE family translocator [Marinomonas sp.]|nr:MAG: LysE family translocator [Marinomonas sp.]